jgi:eukaryotic-like serine/threonine-protein kinase
MGQMQYAVAMELAEGTVADFAEDNPMRQSRVVAQMAGLLTAVARLHDSGAVHRDITPYNVFVCGPNETLKLGDFGIARHGFKRRPVRADAFAPWFVDTNLYQGSQTSWSVSDDLWQVGQLAAVLLTGVVRPIATREVRDLPCSDSVKYTIRRAIGEPAYRFPDAAAMSAALRRDTPLRFARLRTLNEKTVVFTGSLGRDLVRQRAAALAKKAGAQVLPNPSGMMDVLVVGDTSPNWFAGEAGGVKILETISLQEQGYPIKMITGNSFRRLAGVRYTPARL